MGVVRVNPPLPANTGDVLQVAIQIGEVTKTPASFTYPLMSNSFGAGSVAANMVALAASLNAGLSALIEACIPPTATLIGYALSCVSRNDVPDYFLAVGAVGTAGVNSLPNQMGAVIRRGVVLKGQSGRGRLTVPFVPNTFTTPATDPNLINATGVTAYTALMHGLFGTVAPPSWVAGLQTYAPALFTRPLPPATVVSMAGLVLPAYCSLDTILGTQRRRKEGTS